MALTVDIKQIQAFLAIAELGSFRRAAERLNTTQPNISARIAKLEARLGVTLMDRDAGSVRLTRKGKALLEPARAISAALDGFLTAVRDDALYEGVIRLGVTELIAHTWLRQYLRAMRDRFPNVTVELTVDLSETLSGLLHDHDLDLALQNGPFARPMSGSIPLCSHPHLWVGAPGIAPLGSLSAERIAGYPILSHARGTAPWRQLTQHFRAEGVAPRLVPSSNIAACLQMTLDGLGIACLPRPLVETPLAEGRLVALDYPWRQDDLRFEARFDADHAPAYLREAASLARQVAMAEDKEVLSSE